MKSFSLSPGPHRCYFSTACWLLLLAASAIVRADEDNDDEPLYRPGLVAEYRGTDGEAVKRVDRAVVFNWRGESPDRRLPVGPFTGHWQGLLQTEAEGKYQLFVHAAGKVVISLNGQVVLKGQNERAGWLESKPVELPYGYYTLDIQFERINEEARLGLYWSGPRFQLEPLGERQLFHRREETPPGRFERGEQLVRALRCAACHIVGGEPSVTAAPDLSHLAGNISRSWLIDWLASDGKERSDQPAVRRMPTFGLSRDDAQAVAAHLWKTSKPHEPSQEKLGQRTAGETLLLTTGCLACHRVGELGESGLFDGGDLTHVADKRPAEFFSAWLAEPAKLNRQHRMPVFDLSAKERADLSAYLAELKSSDKPQATGEPPDFEKQAERGAALVAQNGCLECHAPDRGGAKKPAKRPLSDKSRWDMGCLTGPDLAKHRPGYQLSAPDAAAVREFVTAMSQVKEAASLAANGKYLLAERNCVACHARDASPGLAAKLAAVAEHRGDLATLVPAMTPPTLASVGDKLLDAVLADSITCKGAPVRPWLKVRMPKFDLSPAELESLSRHFIDADRIPELPPSAKRVTLPQSDKLHASGARLVTSDGFGCTSCHQVGKFSPPSATLNARGPSLSLTGQRVREAWFDRWVRNPSRIVPRMEMPSVQIPVRGVLAEKLDDQLAAVWQVLNEPGFEPPAPGPVRVVRRTGLERKSEQAVVLTDVLTQDKQTWIKPLVIGLSNRHTGLFDLETNRLAGWWMGDTARQRTKGKSWYWEPGGVDILQSGIDGSEVLLVRDGKPLSPLVVGQFSTELDSWEQVPDGVEFTRRLHFPDEKGKPLVVAVREKWSSFWFLKELGASGWSRDVRFDGIPAGAAIEFRIVAKERIAADLRDEDGWTLELKGPKEVHIEMDMDHDGQKDRSGSIVLESEEENSSLDFRLDYITKLPIDEFLAESPPPLAVEPQKLNVVPGYEAVRLPLLEEMMPTALAWMPDGKLAIASLKGQIYLARDKNGDGLEELVTVFADGLAAPYGLLAGVDEDGAQYLDVVTKFALLRLHDDDEDGRADRTVTLASGWGHTADYHDWVVGIEQDDKGNRYVAIPCEQDKRSVAAATLRGKLVKLIPRAPTGDDPRQYRLEEFAGGLRFPMGLARSRSGDLFVTDNQGNFNPFNELNHIIPGQRYGFINSLEKAADFPAPPMPAAIEIPHPWTRSVNGLCFLLTPDKNAARPRPAAIKKPKGPLGEPKAVTPIAPPVPGKPPRPAPPAISPKRETKEPPSPPDKPGERAKAVDSIKHFGPFEGHLIGCEYDTRRLIRMSLEKVGDTYQGACYPFTYDTPQDGPSLLGPITCAVSPSGDLYIGCVRDSGWGGANNIGAVTRLRPNLEKLPAGIAEARATKTGFTLDFTKAVDLKLAADLANYSASSYRRVSTPAYGGPDLDRRVEKLVKVSVSADALHATLDLPELREGFVYEIRLKNLAGGKREFHPAEAYYTLRKVPK